MRTAIPLALLLVLPQVAALAADAPARWEERPFFARRPGQHVPPPQYYATTEELPAGAEVRIRVVRCPDKAAVAVRHFIGGPVFSTGVVKEFSGLAVDQKLSCTLGDRMKVGITATVDGKPAVCKGLERKDGTDLLKYAVGDQELVFDVEIVRK